MSGAHKKKRPICIQCKVNPCVRIAEYFCTMRCGFIYAVRTLQEIRVHWCQVCYRWEDDCNEEMICPKCRETEKEDDQ